ncbi:MAG: winged helix-turn-helix transcriptional regulator [Flavobacteriales bacterium]|nr:winged helix-turn-helix transcriptional regulator [Flavobacteriales bacterium]
METKISKILKIDAEELQERAEMLKAMAHPTRIAMIEMLYHDKEMTVTEIHSSLDIEQAVASNHLGILKNKNIVKCHREGKKMFYSLKMQNVHSVIQCMLDS